MASLAARTSRAWSGAADETRGQIGTVGPAIAAASVPAFFARHIAEIGADRALTLYGAALAAANVVTFVVWKFGVGVPLMIGRGADSFCWPFLANCHAFQLPVFIVNYGLWGYLFFSLVAGYCFLARRVVPAYWLLLLVNAIRVLVRFQDYRLRANQHYMLNWVVLAFLFLPGKRALLHHVVVSLYVWAGALKLNWDWLSGASLYNQERLWFPRALVPAGCLYVVVLEMVLIWNVYARRGWLFWGALAQLFLFHVTSWPIVGFFYPVLMFCILSILPLARVLHPPRSWVRLPWAASGGSRVLHTCVIGAFGALQLIPHAFPGDTAITGEGRVFALHMFDALVECEATITYHTGDGGAHHDSLEQTTRMPHRSRCDPMIYFDMAKNACEDIRASGAAAASGAPAGAVDLDLRLRSKRNTEAAYHQVIDIRRFCATDPRYDMWRHNAWIQVPRQG